MNYIKAILAFGSAIIIFFLGGLKAKNDELGQELKQKEESEKNDNELLKRVVTRDNTSSNSKRDFLRSRASKVSK